MAFKTTTLTIHTYDPEQQTYDQSQAHTVTLREETGLRLILGEPNDREAPDLLVEREKDRWRIFVHARDYGDPLCIIDISRQEAVVRADDPEIPEPLLTVPLAKETES